MIRRYGFFIAFVRWQIVYLEAPARAAEAGENEAKTDTDDTTMKTATA